MPFTDLPTRFRDYADGGDTPTKPPEVVLDLLDNIPEGDKFWDDFENPRYLFAFDHLMDQSYVARFVKGLRPAKMVRLPHHRLCWPFYLPPQDTAVPSIARTNNPDDNVWGILYQTNNVDLKELEQHMRVPNRYFRKSILVMDRGDRRMAAFCYAINGEPADLHKPSALYIERMVDAAENRKLPEEWIASLRQIETA